jgi:hypothetical protein
VTGTATRPAPAPVAEAATDRLRDAGPDAVTAAACRVGEVLAGRAALAREDTAT